MTKQKIASLMIVGVAIVGSIVYLNSTKVEQAANGSEDAVNIIPRCEASGNCPQVGDEGAEATPSAVTPTNSPSVAQPSAAPSKTSSVLAIDKSKMYPVAKEITTPDNFINTGGLPITIQGLIGKKVILVDFWTYSCINCQRTQPYLNAWYEKYKDQGLEIIGMHTPEFEFEKKYENVAKAVEDDGIKYPVVMDNDFSTWGAYGNRFWPRKYLIDIDGYIVYDHIGEGAYAETEAKIQELLKERKKVLGEKGEVTGGVVQTVSSTPSLALSPETYFGAARNTNLGNGKQGAVGALMFTDPSDYDADTFYLSGFWNIQSQFAENQNGPASIKFKYRGKEVFFVASSDASDGVTVKVLIDGKPVPTSMRGSNVSAEGTVLIKGEGLYKIIKDGVHGEHLLELQIEKPGLKAFTFTFG
jgi:thiol-disulfide isomerase/thioredoxin